MTTATGPRIGTRRLTVCLAGAALGVGAITSTASAVPTSVTYSAATASGAARSQAVTVVSAGSVTQADTPDIWQWWQDETRPGLQEWLDNGGAELVGPGGVPANPEDFPNPNTTDPAPTQPAPQPDPTKPIPDAPVQDPAPPGPGGGFGDLFDMLQGMLSMLISMVGGFFGFSLHR